MKIRLIVPNHWPCPQPCTRECHNCPTPVDLYGREIAEIAGGFTAWQATGGWIAPDATLVVEPVTVFDCYLPQDWCNAEGCLATSAFRVLARRIVGELRQDCVYLEIDGVVEFVKA